MRLFHIATLALLLVAGGQPAIADDGYFIHTVTKGQGLYSISRMYGVTEAEIIALNPGSEQVIRAGQQLRIPQKTGSSTSYDKPASGGKRFHAIKAGETLYRLTVMYGVTAQEIIDANPGLTAENLKVGQVVLIPPVSDKTLQVSSSEVHMTVTPTQQTQQKTTTTREISVEQLQTAKAKTPDCKKQHTVKLFETIYSLSRKYGVSQEALIAANPSLANSKLKLGQVICIPYTNEEILAMEKDAAASKDSSSEDTSVSSDEPAEETPSSGDGYIHTPWDGLNVALILPFMLESTNRSVSSDQSKMVEYYEGFLLAVDSLKHLVVSMNLYVFDSGDAKSSISGILATEGMNHMDIIFGPMHASHIAEAATFARQHNIPLVLPFARDVDQVYDNPMIYQVNTPQSYLNSEVFDHFFATFRKPNVLFFGKQGATPDAFCTALQQELMARGFSYTTNRADTTSNVSHLMEYCDPSADNVIMLTTSDRDVLSKMLPTFQLMARDTLAEVHLFGYPQYQIYATNHLDAFYECDTYFYSQFYTNNTLPDAVAFHKLFSRTYTRDIVNRYPKYAILGFDMGYYFLRALSQYPRDFAQQLPRFRCRTIQTGFRFERVNNWAGFINNKVYFIHFSKEGELRKIDFDE